MHHNGVPAQLIMGGIDMVYNIRLVQTCSSCPEQYEAFIGEVQVGYLRLRHGRFSVRVPDVDGKEIYFATPDGDGSFCDYERDRYLTTAKIEIQRKLDDLTETYGKYRSNHQ